MKLFLMLALSLVAMTTGRQPIGFVQKTTTTTTTAKPNDQTPGALDFMDLDENLDENDLNVAFMEKYSRQATENLETLLDNFGKISPASKAEDSDVPDVLQEALSAGVSLFNSSSATNAMASPAAAARSISISPRPYHCPHNTHQLRWFPLVTGSTVTAYCFVPSFYWPVTYATCPQPRCTTNSHRTGRCLPSCYNRRRLRVLCISINGSFPWIYWTTVTRNLPQACRCSTC